MGGCISSERWRYYLQMTEAVPSDKKSSIFGRQASQTAFRLPHCLSGRTPNPLTLQVNKSERNDENEQKNSHQKHERDQWKEYERMAEKEEVRYYSDNKIEIDGKMYNVTFTFPLPKDETETAYDKLKHLINGEKVS